MRDGGVMKVLSVHGIQKSKLRRMRQVKSMKRSVLMIQGEMNRGGTGKEGESRKKRGASRKQLLGITQI